MTRGPQTIIPGYSAVDVGIAFASAIAEELGFSHIFPLFYGSIAVVTVLLAIATSRLPPRALPRDLLRERGTQGAFRR